MLDLHVAIHGICQLEWSCERHAGLFSTSNQHGRCKRITGASIGAVSARGEHGHSCQAAAIFELTCLLHDFLFQLGDSGFLVLQEIHTEQQFVAALMMNTDAHHAVKVMLVEGHRED